MTDLHVYRHTGIQLLLDANRINSRQKDPDMNQLERWYEDEVVNLLMSESSQEEARADGNRLRARKAIGYAATTTYAGTPGEREQLRRIEAVLSPNGATTQNERNDIDIVFNAEKYGGILVTHDGGSKRQPGGILGNAVALEALGVRVMRASKAVRFVRERIDARDQMARQACERYGVPLPEWVGKD